MITRPVISVAHSQTHIQTQRLQQHMPLALIKGKNVIDRGEIRAREMERWRERRKEGERERSWLSHFSDQAGVCVTFTRDKPGTHSSNTWDV